MNMNNTINPQYKDEVAPNWAELSIFFGAISPMSFLAVSSSSLLKNVVFFPSELILYPRKISPPSSSSSCFAGTVFLGMGCLVSPLFRADEVVLGAETVLLLLDATVLIVFLALGTDAAAAAAAAAAGAGADDAVAIKGRVMGGCHS